MEHYFKKVSDGYILSIVKGETGQTEISEAEYNQIMAVIEAKPTAEEGYDYRLKSDLSWELYELPPMPEEDAIEQDYIDALNELGVDI